MGWVMGTIVVIALAIFVPWLFAEIAAKFGTENDWDHVADRKRKTARRAQLQSREYR